MTKSKETKKESKGKEPVYKTIKEKRAAKEAKRREKGR